MDVIIVCHTEFGCVYERQVIFGKKVTSKLEEGVTNLLKVADKHNAKVTFAVCPEVVDFFPQGIDHEIGLHLHPGWEERQVGEFTWYAGDAYLKKTCRQSVDSTALWDYPLGEQFEMMEAGKDCLEKRLGVKPRVFVAGRWSENNDTIQALIKAGFTHDCSPYAHSRAGHYDWSDLPRICMPYHPSEQNYQRKGSLPLLIIPVSRLLLDGNVNPEVAPRWGLPWLRACFREYYYQGLPLFHMCLHSPCMTDPYFVSVMDELLRFISRYDISFKFASEVEECPKVESRPKYYPYLLAVNVNMMKTVSKALMSKLLISSS